jgi:hypothetical protein
MLYVDPGPELLLHFGERETMLRGRLRPSLVGENAVCGNEPGVSGRRGLGKDGDVWRGVLGSG